MTHPKSKPCPFKIDNNPIGMLGTCCSFRGSPVVWYLFALGAVRLVFDLYSDKTFEGAITFAGELRSAVRTLRGAMNDMMQKTGEPSDKPIDETVVGIPDVGWKFPIGEAFEAIEAAARWHEKIGQMGYGVKAWY